MIKYLLSLISLLSGFLGFAQNEEMDKNVSIEFLVVEYEHGNGFDWGIDITSGTYGQFSNINYSPGANGGALSFDFDFLSNLDPSFKVNLQALVQNNHASIVTNPQISVRNNHEAVIESKVTRYIQLQTASINGLTTDLKELDAGVHLVATPSILNDSIVNLDVQGEVSDFVFTSVIGEYTIESNNIDTKIDVKTGQTLIIGGLIKSEEFEIKSRVPILGDIPLVGLLFKRKETRKREVEMVIYITPLISNSGYTKHQKLQDKGQRLIEKTESRRERKQRKKEERRKKKEYNRLKNISS